MKLRGRDKDRVKTYSLGMKQRLGVAMALLQDPELLVLDEPANGLDPAGIVEMRDLMRSLAASGKTVFISSHVLTEVRQICTRVAILNLGKLITETTVEELVAGHGQYLVQLDPSYVQEALALVRQQPWVRKCVLEYIRRTRHPSAWGPGPRLPSSWSTRALRLIASRPKPTTWSRSS